VAGTYRYVGLRAPPSASRTDCLACSVKLTVRLADMSAPPFLDNHKDLIARKEGKG
jgi:hypothetical protein